MQLLRGIKMWSIAAPYFLIDGTAAAWFLIKRTPWKRPELNMGRGREAKVLERTYVYVETFKDPPVLYATNDETAKAATKRKTFDVVFRKICWEFCQGTRGTRERSAKI